MFGSDVCKSVRAGDCDAGGQVAGQAVVGTVSSVAGFLSVCLMFRAVRCLR